jgi:hypothetical protein
MSERAKANLPLIVTVLTMICGGIWAVAQRDADLSNIQHRQTHAEARLDKVEAVTSGIEGDIKAIRAVVERVEKKLP